MGTSTRSHSLSTTTSPSKRSIQASPPSTPPKKARISQKAVPATPNPAPAVSQGSLVSSKLKEDNSEQIIIRPKLSFDYAAAKAHLIAVDPRFEPLMTALKCKPFEEESDLNPFRALCSSILGQQVRKHRERLRLAKC